MNKQTLLSSFLELAVTLVILLLLLVIANPWYMWMPKMSEMVLSCLLLLALVLYAVFILREQVRDERDEYYRLVLSRLALLTTSGVLVIGLLVGLSEKAVDPWLAGALAALVVTKTCGSIWIRYKG